MSGTARGRRTPPPLPELSKLSWEMARRVIWEHLKHQGDAYDGLPSPHADTHLLGGSDALQFPDAPSTIQAGLSADAGVGPAFAAEDHVHAVSTGTAVALGTAEGEGAGAALARAAHVHKRAIEVQVNDVLVATRRIVDFRDSATATIAGVDNAGADRVEITVNVTGASSVITPATITGDQNDYNPGVGEIVRLSSDAARSITGFVSGASGGRRIWVNVGAFNITLKHQDAASAAANRLLCQGGADIVLPANFAAAAWYDSTTQRWRVYAL